MEELALVTQQDFAEYRNLLLHAPEATLYHTKEYVDFIANHLEGQAFILALKEHDKILAAFPFVLKKNSNFGNIINSNPYFGSYGGLLVHPDLTPIEKKRVKRTLLNAFNKFGVEQGCVLSVIIASPLDRDQPFYFENLQYDYLDSRVGQVTILPSAAQKSLRESLLYDKFSKSCRTAVRSAEKKGVLVKEASENGNALDEFFKIYRQNMEAKGGLVKEKSFFTDAIQTFPRGLCKLRYAEINDKVIAGIFHFYFKNIVEYFTTAIDPAYRNTGATNLLIYTGMEHAANNGYVYWNFGGTWNTQEDVYKFKRSFGALDFVYYYFVQVYSDINKIKELPPAELRKEYSGFYIIPFSELRQQI